MPTVMKVAIGDGKTADVYIGIRDGAVIFAVDLRDKDIGSRRADIESALAHVAPQILGTAYGWRNLKADPDAERLAEEEFNETQQDRLHRTFIPGAVINHLANRDTQETIRKGLAGVNLDKILVLTGDIAKTSGVTSLNQIEKMTIRDEAESVRGARSVLLNISTPNVLEAVRAQAVRQMKKAATAANAMQATQLVVNYDTVSRLRGNPSEIIKTIKDGGNTVHLEYTAIFTAGENPQEAVSRVIDEVVSQYKHGFASVILDVHALPTPEAAEYAVNELRDKGVTIKAVRGPEGFKMDGIASSVQVRYQPYGKTMVPKSGMRPVAFLFGLTNNFFGDLDAGNLDKYAEWVLPLEEIANLQKEDKDSIDQYATASILEKAAHYMGADIDPWTHKREIHTVEDARQFAYDWPISKLPVLSISQWAELRNVVPGTHPDRDALVDAINEIADKPLQNVFVGTLIERSQVRNFLSKSNSSPLDPLMLSKDDREKMFTAYMNNQMPRQDEMLLARSLVRFFNKQYSDTVTVASGSYEDMKLALTASIMRADHAVSRGDLVVAINMILNDLLESSQLKDQMPEKVEGIDLNAFNRLLAAA
jgi:hypothetical protein